MARGLSLWGEGIVTEADRGSTLAPMEEGRFAVVTDGPSGNQMFVLDAFGQELSVKDIAVPLSFGSYSVVNLYYADVGIAYVDNTLAGDGDLRFLEQGEYSRVLDDSTANDTSVGDVEATAGGGGYWVIWTRQEPGGTSVLMRKFDSSSDAASPEVVVRAAAQYVAVPELAVLKNGNVVAFWRAGDTDDALALSLRVWNAQGSPISAEIQVNAEAQSTRPVVEALANGNFVVTWQNVGQGGIYHQVFDASGAAVSSRQFQNADTGTLPKITALPDGGYVLGWTDLRLDSGGDPVVVLQRFDATSAIDGERFVLSTMGTVNLQGFATLSDGRIALTTWSETDMFSDNFDVRYYIIETRSFEIDGSEGEDDLVGGVGDSQLNGFGGYDRLTGMDGDDTLSGHAGDDTLEAGGGDDLVRGGSGGDMLGGGQGDDTLEGGSGDDYLAGDSGADRMVGGSGNDRYDLTSSVDTIIEVAGGGTDTVASSISLTLGSHLENLSLGGTANLRGTGNALANQLQGNSGANILDGASGADTMEGNGGNDTYHVDNALDVVTEFGEAFGTDTVVSSVTHVLGSFLENLTLTGTAALDGTGNALVNVLRGNAGANILDGGGGPDTMYGGAGNDTYRVGNAGDVVSEASGAGTDTVISSVTRTLGDHQENLTLIGTAALRATGNALRNVLQGNEGANVLDGAVGADTMAGGAGNDTYHVGELGDVIQERASQGVDTVVAGVSWNLGSNQENLSLVGTAGSTGTGNALANDLRGNAAANRLDGGGGNDSVYGASGNDTILGAAGADIIRGGYGRDALTGGADGDRFVYVAASESTGTAFDVITDFTRGADKIDLSRIDANGSSAGTSDFDFIGGAAFSADATAQIRYVRDGSSGRTMIYGSTDADAQAEFAIQLVGSTVLGLSDFLL